MTLDRTVWKWLALSLLLHLTVLMLWRGHRTTRPLAAREALLVSISATPPAGRATTDRSMAPPGRPATLARPLSGHRRRPSPLAADATRARPHPRSRPYAHGPVLALSTAAPSVARAAADPSMAAAGHRAALATAASRADDVVARPSAADSAAGASGSGASGVPSGAAATSVLNAPARVLSSTQPAYPAIARENGWEGLVRLQVRLDADGQPQAVRLLQRSRYAVLDQRAVTAAEHWRYAPAVRNGHPMPSSLDLSVRFQLEDAE